MQTAIVHGDLAVDSVGDHQAELDRDRLLVAQVLGDVRRTEVIECGDDDVDEQVNAPDNGREPRPVVSTE